MIMAKKMVMVMMVKKMVLMVRVMVTEGSGWVVRGQMWQRQSGWGGGN